MEDKLQVYATSRQKWRKWLEKNHAKNDEAWLIYYKKATGKPSVTYRESVEEAICFGWIDGIKKRIDDERYTHRFSPRNSKSKWSDLNIRLAENMIRENKMTEAGLKVFKRKQKYEESVVEMTRAKEIELTPEIERILKSNKRAWMNYQKLSPSHRKQYAAWLTTAKRPETIQKRIKEAIHLLENDEKLGMK
ncbi:MAG: YdeI/OmpD-associated family protein [Saprospiraceae bacterium]|nr:YdeI/OmpD-associated family protein [Saprospiraceae bacterium]